MFYTKLGGVHIVYFFLILSVDLPGNNAELILINEQAVVRNGAITYLKCMSGDMEISHSPFRRYQDTGSGPRITSMSLVGPIKPESWPGKRLTLFPDAGPERTGVYSCEGMDPNTNVLSKVVGIKIGSSGVIWPSYFTYTASIEDQNFNISCDSFEPTIGVLWRFSGHLITGSRPEKLKRTIPRVSAQDAGIYECYKPPDDANEDIYSYRPLDQGILRVIVRLCPRDKWNSPRCDQDCACVNGGACDHVTGYCVCPPGFHGDRCENGCGGNRFGNSCKYHCKEGGSNHGKDAEECRGKHFCLPDPYGCSCSTGFMGLECTNGCPLGMFGADCKETCHCKRVDLCDRFTGSCTLGCASGWNGPSCQYPCEGGTWGENCENKCRCYNNARCDAVTGYCPNERCAFPFTGKTCQVDSIDECSSNPCSQGSTCVDEVNEFNCQCVNGTGGIYCETDYDDCLSSPCQHGATCIDEGPLKYSCACADGYKGINCEINIDDCESHRCSENSECVDKIMTYNCKCKPGYIGRYCQDQCNTGTFYDVTYEECYDCPINTYQDTKGQIECISCPTGQSTNTVGAKSAAQCISDSADSSLLTSIIIGSLVGVIVLIAIGLGLWFVISKKNNVMRLEHLGGARSAW